MTLSIHQPSYFPWLGLLDKIAKTDTYVLLDDNQVVKGTYQYRNIFFCNGNAKYLTLPLNYSLGLTFNDLTFKNTDWPAKHLNLLQNYYRKAPFFKEIHNDIMPLFEEFKHMSPIEVLQTSMQYCFVKLNISVKLLKSKEIPYQSKKAEMVLEICKHLKADQYLAGRGSNEYMQPVLNKFTQSGIKVLWHSFKHPVYPQHPQLPFVEGLSVLDLFFFTGFEQANKIFWDNINHNGK